MEAREEGQRAEQPAKAHQGFLPGLENLGPGWTVFGPPEEEDEGPEEPPPAAEEPASAPVEVAAEERTEEPPPASTPAPEAVEVTAVETDADVAAAEEPAHVAPDTAAQEDIARGEEAAAEGPASTPAEAAAEEPTGEPPAVSIPAPEAVEVAAVETEAEVAPGEEPVPVGQEIAVLDDAAVGEAPAAEEDSEPPVVEAVRPEPAAPEPPVTVAEPIPELAPSAVPAPPAVADRASAAAVTQETRADEARADRPPLPATAPARGPAVGPGRSTLPWGLTLAACVAAVTAIVLWARLNREVHALESELARVEPVASDPDALREIEELRRQVLELDAELERSRAAEQRAVTAEAELTSVRSRLTERVETIEGELGRLEGELVEERAARERDQAQAVRARERGEELGRQLAAANLRLEALGEEADALRSEARRATESPASRQAQGFDRILARLEAGEGAAARAALETLVEAGDLDPDGGDGSACLASLVAGAAAIEQAEVERATSTSPAAGALLSARASLESAESGRATFERAAAGWLAEGDPQGSPTARLDRLDRALAGLRARLEAEIDDLEALHEQDWSWILASGPRQAPELAEQHAASFGCGHAEELAELYAAAVSAACVATGELRPGPLAEAEHLGAWGRRALARPLEARSEADHELLWLWYARRWYSEGEAPTTFDWSGLAVPEVLSAGDDWRAELRLQVALALPGSGWPIPTTVTAVYRVEGDTPARWRADVRLGEVPGDGWRLARAHFGGTGVPLGEPVAVDVQRDGRRSHYAGSEAALLDLGATGAAVGVAPFPHLALETPPPTTGAGAVDARALAARVEAGPGPCLVYREGGWTRWFAPGLGLVREERSGPQGAVRIELAALGEAP